MIGETGTSHYFDTLPSENRNSPFGTDDARSAASRA